ncbi:MAG: hypothetical protein C9356_20365 [Oleiphilus sp.]|nr:MAG: hypothetical protein C9356_20365 [Oleiphilus sp.]
MSIVAQSNLVNNSDLHYRITLLKKACRWYVTHEKGVLNKALSVNHEFDTRYSHAAQESLDHAVTELKSKGYREIEQDLVPCRNTLAGYKAGA